MVKKVKSKALLIGISEYGEGIPPLKIVPNDIEILQESLEKSDFTVETLLSSKNKEATKTAILRAIAKVGKSQHKLETLLIYFSGHGIHYQDRGEDYILTSEASQEDLEDLSLCLNLLVSPAEINKCISRANAETIVIFVDACRQGVSLEWEEETKGLVLSSWGDENKWRAVQCTVLIFACEKGGYSQFFSDKDGSDKDGFSLFTRALADVIDPDCYARTIQQVFKETQEKLNRLIKEKEKEPQTIRCIVSERGADSDPMSIIICEGSSADILVEKDSNPWTEATEKSRLWSTDKTDDPELEQLKQQVTKVVGRCWQEWEAAVKAFPEDAWRDENLPVRAVNALVLLASCSDPRIELSSAETALLLVVPFLREAVLASAIVRAAEVNPLALNADGPKNDLRDLRRALEKTHQSLPRFVRRVERLEASGDKPDRNAVMAWMLHRCLLRSLEIWRSPSEGGYLSDKLLESLQPSHRDPKLVRDAFQRERLLELAKSMFADIEWIDRQDRQPKVTVGDYGQEQDLRQRLLACLLNLAGWLAIDIRTLSDVVVDHIGLTNAIDPGDVLQTVSNAEWRPFAKGRALVTTCRHPAADLALRTHVENADAVLSQVLEKAEQHAELHGLKGLPPYLKSDRIVPESQGGKFVYKTPHVNFQLAHDEIRELLMGKQLYGDPTLAIRELYQNALDACRYRQARLQYLKRAKQRRDLNWQGKIIFRQGYEDGRAFLECEDNGIGMGMLHLSQCFARAGRRFTEHSEFIEEQDDWLQLNPPISLYPNSQFGIGVLSYFMLADEIRVETRRLNRNWFPEESLLVLIPGSSGLFQIRKGPRDDSGTLVRLYLNRTHDDDDKPISCVRVLKELLWVAEFPTQAQEFDKQNQPTQSNSWEPGQLQHPELSPEECLNTGHPELWWIAKPEKGRVLADGLRTEKEYPIVVNLRQEYYPKLTVDRKNIVEWKESWVNETLEKQFDSLRDWSHFTFRWLWDLEEVKALQLNEKIVNCFVRERFPILFKLRDFKYQIPIAMTRCSKIDRQICESISEKGFGKNITQNMLSDLLSSGIPKHLYYRGRMWANLLSNQYSDTSTFHWHSNLWPLLTPRDTILLSDNHYNKNRYISNEEDYIGVNFIYYSVSLEHLLHSSFKLNRPISEIVQRLQQFVPFGLKLPELDEQALSSLRVSEDDLIVLSSNLDGRIRMSWQNNKVPLGNILHASFKLNRPVSEIVQRLQRFVPLGLELPRFDEQVLSSLNVSKEDLILLSQNLDGRSPWLEEVVPPLYLPRAVKLNLSISEIVQRLRRFVPFGLKLPALDEQALSSIKYDDLILLSQDLDGYGPWLEEVVPLSHLLGAFVKLNLSMSEIVQRLQRFVPFGLELPQIDEQAFSSLGVERYDRILLSQNLNVNYRFLEAVPLLHLLKASEQLNLPMIEIVQRLQRFVPLGLELPALDWPALFELEPTEDDFRMLSKHFDGDMPLLEGDVSRLHIARSADLRNEPVTVTFERFKQLAPVLGLNLPEDDPESWDLDSLFQP